MPKPSHAAAAFALLLLAAQPCAAADDLRDGAPGIRRTAPFAGVSLSLPLSGSARAAPSARLQFTPARAAGGALGRPAAAPGLELGLAPTGKPALYLGGRPTADLGRRLNLGGKTETALIVVGGLVLLVLLAAAVADAQPTAGPDEGTFD